MTVLHVEDKVYKITGGDIFVRVDRGDSTYWRRLSPSSRLSCKIRSLL